MASHLKAAGKAILNSPKALRRKLAGGSEDSHHDSKFGGDVRDGVVVAGGRASGRLQQSLHKSTSRTVKVPVNAVMRCAWVVSMRC